VSIDPDLDAHLGFGLFLALLKNSLSLWERAGERDLDA
jgi:hypothetical protein